MEMEEFASGNSWVHKLDPRVKIIVTMVFSVVVALNNHLEMTAISMILPVILLVFARLDFGKVITSVPTFS
jgi:cobalt/nickel transport system permease protein